jgi:hypothetical protein
MLKVLVSLYIILPVLTVEFIDVFEDDVGMCIAEKTRRWSQN